MAPAVLIVLSLLVVATQTLSQRSTVVKTTLGPVQGVRKTTKGRDVDVYYGIPFAKPPVGTLRFKPPLPAEPWVAVRDAVSKPNSCFQTLDTSFNRFPGVEMWNPNTPMSEDCLYLNVWVPRGFGSQPPRATMVWIFGGGFWSGTSTLDVYDGSKLAATENVIVVSINYRVGPLGFLYTATDDAPGNQGMLDQVMALKWVYDNVANFGGSQETITIFGESAGATSVGLHLMSPLSMNYFSRAIMQSASPTADWSVQSEAQATVRAQRLASTLGCPVSSTAGMVTCLQRADAQNVTDSMWNLVSHYFELPFAPIVDNHFLPAHPRDLLARGEVKDTEIIIGANKDEGIFWLLYAFPDEFPLDNGDHLSREDFKQVLKRLNFNGDEKKNDAITYEYVDSILPGARESYRDISDDISGDDLFKCPIVDFAKAYAALSPTHDVYMYSFEQRLSSNPWPAWTGVMHGYEIEAMFGLPLDFNYTQEEVALTERVTAFWTRFAQFG